MLFRSYVPNFAGLGSPLLKAFKSTLETLKAGNVTLAAGEDIKDTYKYSRAPQGLYDSNIDEIVLNTSRLPKDRYDAASLMAHEGTHRVLARTDNETLKEFVSTLLEKGTHPEKIRDLPVPIGIRQKLANSSIDFEDLASPDVKNYFPSYHRVTSLPELYHKGNFLEEIDRKSTRLNSSH